MRSGDVQAMEEGWIFRRLPGLIPVTGGSVAGMRGWRTPLPADAPRGSRSPAAAAGEEVIADRREAGPKISHGASTSRSAAVTLPPSHICPVCPALGQRTGTHSAWSRCDD